MSDNPAPNAGSSDGLPVTGRTPVARQGIPGRRLLTRAFRRIDRLVLVLIVMGLTWRVLRYLLAFPLWGDESMVATTLIVRDLATVTQPPLEYGQIAPPAWMILEFAIKQMMGLSEYSLHLLSLVCGVLSLPLFWRLVRQVTDRRSAMLATGILAASMYPVRHANELKPYAGDLLASLFILLLAWSISQKPKAIGRWIALALLGAAVGWFSYPAIFVAVGAGVFLGWVVLRNRSPRALAGLMVYAAVAGAGVLALLVLYAGPQNTLTPGYDKIWEEAFPPPLSQPGQLAWWLLDVHTSNMVAYPFGGKHFASTGTALLIVIGCVHFWRSARRDLLILLLAPLVLTFIASIPKRYPYGTSARTMLHMAPAFCLLAGTGLSVVLRRLLKRRLVPEGHRAAAVMLAASIVVGMVVDAVWPYKALSNQQTRRIARELAAQTSPGDQWVFAHSFNTGNSLPLLSGNDSANFRVYVARFLPSPILWGPPPEAIPQVPGKTRMIYFYDPLGIGPEQRQQQFASYFQALCRRLGQPQQTSFSLYPAQGNVGPQRIDVYDFPPQTHQPGG